MTTTPTINGLRLVTPAEAGYENNGRHATCISAVVLNKGKPVRCVSNDGIWYFESELIPIFKPKTIRPYRRGEVKWEWKFRNKASGKDYAIGAIEDVGLLLFGFGCVIYQNLLNDFLCLT